jgi:hypothetical protein
MHAYGSQQRLNPRDGPSSLTAQREEGALPRSGEGYEKRIQLFRAIWRQAPPRLVIKPVKDHGVEFQALAFVNGHKRDLSQTFKFVQSDRPGLSSFRAFLQQQHKPVPNPIEVPRPLIGREGLSHLGLSEKRENLAGETGRRLGARFNGSHIAPQLPNKLCQASLYSFLRPFIDGIGGLQILKVLKRLVPVLRAPVACRQSQERNE